jgi:hypothetical protein
MYLSRSRMAQVNVQVSQWHQAGGMYCVYLTDLCLLPCPMASAAKGRLLMYAPNGCLPACREERREYVMVTAWDEQLEFTPSVHPCRQYSNGRSAGTYIVVSKLAD